MQAKGASITGSDEHEARRVAFLGTDAAKQLFPEGGAVGQQFISTIFPTPSSA